jgi:hypothetical protein
VTPAEKQEWWRRTVAALEARDPRVHVALLTALCLRHGRLVDDLGQKSRVIERVSLEELMHVTNGYAFGVRAPEYGIIEIQAVTKEEANGRT